MPNTGLLKQPPVVAIIVAGCLIAMLSFGVRSSFGLFLEPMTTTRGWDRETFALAMAIQNLLWGFGVPIAGALADRYGPVVVMLLGSIVYAAGLWAMSVVEAPFAFYMTAGVLTGIGVAFTSFSLVMTAMAKAVGPERRSLAMGAGASAGSFGQVIFSPLGLVFIESFGWEASLTYMAFLVLMIIPLAVMLPKSRAAGMATVESEVKFATAIKEAFSHRGFLLLTAGFFVCGFHVSFISVHLPAYVVDLGMEARVGAYALAIVGLFNILGAFLGGAAGQKWSKKSALTVIYFLRGIVITGLVLAPPSELTIYIFAATMGMLWLSTVPLTNAIVGQVFGMQWLGTLFGLVFLSHQLGSFIGVWLGGYVYDSTGSYDFVWWCGVGLAFVAAGLHWPINETPLARLQVGDGQVVLAKSASTAQIRAPRAPARASAQPEIVIASGLVMIAIAVAMHFAH